VWTYGPFFFDLPGLFELLLESCWLNQKKNWFIMKILLCKSYFPNYVWKNLENFLKKFQSKLLARVATWIIRVLNLLVRFLTLTAMERGPVILTLKRKSVNRTRRIPMKIAKNNTIMIIIIVIVTIRTTSTGLNTFNYWLPNLLTLYLLTFIFDWLLYLLTFVFVERLLHLMFVFVESCMYYHLYLLSVFCTFLSSLLYLFTRNYYLTNLHF
jgi:hypothetical protein